MTAPFSPDSYSRPTGGHVRVTVMAAVAVITLVLAGAYRTSTHGWGDDFAGYLLQARALAEGRARAEVALNGDLVNNSDRRTGPDGYPWGVPALLAATATVTGWDVNALKVIGVASMVALTALHLWLLSLFPLGPRGIAVCAALVLWQPALLREVDIIGSDLPFLALSGAFLVLAIPAVRQPAGTRSIPTARLALAGLVAALSFTVRSNGIILLGATVLAAAHCLLTGYAVTRRQVVIGVAAFAAAAVAGYAVFFTLLPDGTSIHLALLTPEPGRYPRRIQEIVGDMTRFVPVRWLPDAVDHFVVLALIPLALAGVRVLGAAGRLLFVVLAAHTLLLVLFPQSDGLRYYLPLLPPLVILCWHGAASLIERASRAWPTPAGQPRLTTLVTALFLGGVLVAAGPPDESSQRMRGPLSASFAELTREVTRVVPPARRLSFFRPRAMRWFSGRETLAVTTSEHLDRVDAVALYRHLPPEEAPWLQPDEHALTSGGQFALVFENADFRLYVRTATRAGRAG